MKTSPFCTMQWRRVPCTGAENCYMVLAEGGTEKLRRIGLIIE